MTESIYLVLNSRNLTIFKSKKLLNIIWSIKLKLVNLKDMYGSDCFILMNK